jgi:hypothetical protein
MTSKCFCTFFGLITVGRSSASSSEGVGNTRNGVLVELFLGVLAGALAGVAAAAAAVDLLFLGDDLAASSCHKQMESGELTSGR